MFCRFRQTHDDTCPALQGPTEQTRCPQTLWPLPLPPPLPGTSDGSPSHSLAYSRMWQCWTHTGCGLFRLGLSLSHTHLGVLHVSSGRLALHPVPFHTRLSLSANRARLPGPGGGGNNGAPMDNTPLSSGRRMYSSQEVSVLPLQWRTWMRTRHKLSLEGSVHGHHLIPSSPKP